MYHTNPQSDLRHTTLPSMIRPYRTLYILYLEMLQMKSENYSMMMMMMIIMSIKIINHAFILVHTFVCLCNVLGVHFRIPGQL